MATTHGIQPTPHAHPRAPQGKPAQAAAEAQPTQAAVTAKKPAAPASPTTPAPSVHPHVGKKIDTKA